MSRDIRRLPFKSVSTTIHKTSYNIKTTTQYRDEILLIPDWLSYDSNVSGQITYRALQFDWNIWHRWDLWTLHPTIVPILRCRPAALWTVRALPSLSSIRTSLARRCRTDRRPASRQTASDAVRRPRRPPQCVPCDHHTSTSAFLPTDAPCTTSYVMKIVNITDI